MTTPIRYNLKLYIQEEEVDCLTWQDREGFLHDEQIAPLEAKEQIRWQSAEVNADYVAWGAAAALETCLRETYETLDKFLNANQKSCNPAVRAFVADLEKLRTDVLVALREWDISKDAGLDLTLAVERLGD